VNGAEISAANVATAIRRIRVLIACTFACVAKVVSVAPYSRIGVKHARGTVSAFWATNNRSPSGVIFMLPESREIEVPLIGCSPFAIANDRPAAFDGPPYICAGADV
jgi:hypothetical protein